MDEQGRWDNYYSNEPQSKFLQHLEGKNLHDQVHYALDFVEEAVTKAISPNGITYYDNKTFLEKIDVARIQNILTEQQWKECKLLDNIESMLDDRPGLSFDSRVVNSVCDRLTLFKHYDPDLLDNRMKFMTSAHNIATETFYKWVI